MCWIMQQRVAEAGKTYNSRRFLIQRNMELNQTKRTDIYNIAPRNVVVVDGFNARRNFELDELKEQIKAKGVLNPITVVPFKYDEGNEKYRLVDGERRCVQRWQLLMRVQILSVSKHFSCHVTPMRRICLLSR